MKPESPFSQIDHPVILIAQAIIAFYLFRLFFRLRKTGQPLPQIIAGLAFGVLANLCARADHKDWFLASDIVQYCTFAAGVGAAFYSVDHKQATEAAKPNAPVIASDFFDRIENRAVWGFGLIVAGVLIYSYVGSYTLQQNAEARTAFVADSIAAAKDAEHTAQLCETNEKIETTLTAVTSISATQTTMLANQVEAKTERKKVASDLKKQIANQSKEVKKTLQTSVIQARPLETTKPKLDTKPEGQKPGFWKRVFGNSAQLNEVETDTLVYQ